MREDWTETEIINVLDTLPNGKKMNQGWSPQCKTIQVPQMKYLEF